MAPLALGTASLLRLFAYRHRPRAMILTAAVLLLAYSTLLRLPASRDVFSGVGLENVSCFLSLLLGSASAAQFSRYAGLLNGDTPERKVWRRLGWATTGVALTIAYVDCGWQTPVPELTAIASDTMNVAVGMLASQIVGSTAHLIIAGVRTLRATPGLPLKLSMVGLMAGGSIGLVYALALVAYPLIDFDHDGTPLDKDIAYEEFLWMIQWPMCMLLAFGCSLCPLKVLLTASTRDH
jgi:hypothetical protein